MISKELPPERVEFDAPTGEPVLVTGDIALSGAVRGEVGLQLEVWEAQGLRDLARSGHTHPIIVDCTIEHFDGLTPKFVKIVDPPVVERAKLLQDLWGSVLATAAGFHTPYPCLVRIDPKVASDLTEEANIRGRPGVIRPGIALGFEYWPGLMEIADASCIDRELMPDAERLFAFDGCLWNRDRSYDNPNCALRDRRIVPFDFGACFTGSCIDSDPRAPYEIAENDILVDHILKEMLSNSPRDWVPVVRDATGWGEDTLGLLALKTPSSWNEEIGRLMSHIRQIRDNTALIPQQIEWSLI